MAKPTGLYLYSDETLKNVELYLEKLTNKTATPGCRLADAIPKEKIDDFKNISAKEQLVYLMNTRQARLFLESDTLQDGSDWNQEETAILGDIAFCTMDTCSFNNGAHNNPYDSSIKTWQDHDTPLETNFLFIAGALLRNDNGKLTPDMREVLVPDGILNEDAFYKLYERRLLPGLLYQNELARRDDKKLVINIPGIGCGAFAGHYVTAVKEAFPRVLKKLFETHANQLDRIHTVNFDPYTKPKKDEFTTQSDSDTKIRLMNRPLMGLPEGAPGSVASQLEFPKDGEDYTEHRLLKIVAWDHFSFPGNDIWGDLRKTDDGVSFASSNVVLALFNMGQFGDNNLVNDVCYSPEEGIAYAVNPKDKKRLTYSELSRQYTSEVTIQMIEEVSTNKFTNNFEQMSKCEQNIEAKMEKFFAEFNKILDEQKNIGRNFSFNEFLKEVRLFRHCFKKTPFWARNSEIQKFREACQNIISSAEGYKKTLNEHSLLYRIVEVFIYAVVGLFVGLGMVLGCVFGQGLLKAEHRQKYSNTFFTSNEADQSANLVRLETLMELIKGISGDENEQLGFYAAMNI
jgi:hypothetical protein